MQDPASDGLTYGRKDGAWYDFGLAAILANAASVSGQVAVLNTNATPLQSYLDTSNTVAIILTNYYTLPNGIVASNLAYTASTNAEAARVIATNALPKSGGTITGNTFWGTNRLYLGTDTNYPWVAGLGTTNIEFGAGTNRAIFGDPW